MERGAKPNQNGILKDGTLKLPASRGRLKHDGGIYTLLIESAEDVAPLLRSTLRVVINSHTEMLRNPFKKHFMEVFEFEHDSPRFSNYIDLKPDEDFGEVGHEYIDDKDEANQGLGEPKRLAPGKYVWKHDICIKPLKQDGVELPDKVIRHKIDVSKTVKKQLRPDSAAMA